MTQSLTCLGPSRLINLNCAVGLPVYDSNSNYMSKLTPFKRCSHSKYHYAQISSLRPSHTHTPLPQGDIFFFKIEWFPSWVWGKGGSHFEADHLQSTTFVGSSPFGGQFQSSVEEATRSQEKLSQASRLASAGSRAAQGTSGSRVPQQSQKRRAVPPPPPPPTAQSVPSRDGGSAAKRHRPKTGNNRRSGGAPAQSQAQPRAEGLQQKASSRSPLMARSHHFLLSHPFWGGDGWVDLSWHSWPGVGYTAWNCTPRSLPCGRQAVVFPASLATDNLGPVCPRGDQTGVLPPFCEANPLVFVSCGDSVAQAAVLCEEVSSLLAKGAVKIVDLSPDQGGFYSHYFLATKRTGGFQPILNLCRLNSFIGVGKFRMETLTSILQGLHKGWWMVSLDLKDAYLHVAIHPSHWGYLRFALRNQAGELIVYQWKILPFGLATVPKVFIENSWLP